MVSPIADRDTWKARLVVSLNVGGYDIFTAYPVTRFESETNGKIHAACLGLMDKMTGAVAIITNHLNLLQSGHVVAVARLKALGTLGK